MTKITKYNQQLIQGTGFEISVHSDGGIYVSTWESEDEDGIPNQMMTQHLYPELRKDGNVGFRLNGKLITRTSKTCREKVEAIVGCSLNYIFHPLVNLALAQSK